MAKEKRAIIIDNDIKDYLDYLEQERRLPENTIKSYRQNLESIAYFINKRIIDKNVWLQDSLKKPLRPLASITKNEIKEYIQFLEAASVTKSHHLTVLKSFFKYLSITKYIVKNPTEAIRSPKVEKKLPKYLTEDEINQLLDIRLTKPVDYRNKAMLEVLYATGLRISELLNLELNQISFEECFIKVMGKGRKERIIPVADTALYFLKLYIYDYRKYFTGNKTSNYVFLNRYGNKLSRKSFFLFLKEQCKKAGIEKEISPHTIRHTFATHLLNNGADLRIIQELLGHENLSTTEIYSHISNERIKKDYENHPRAKKENGIN